MSKKTIPTPHPGEILQKEFLEPIGLTQQSLAGYTALSPSTVGRIVRSEQKITPEVDLRLSLFLGTEEGFWLRLQNFYDMRELKAKSAAKISSQIKPHIGMFKRLKKRSLRKSVI